MKLTVIGSGNMGGAIVRSLASGTMFEASDITCTAKSAGTLEAMKRHCPGINVTNDNAAAVSDADVVIFAVKPWLMEEVMRETAPVLRRSPRIIASVAAGVPFSRMQEWLGSLESALFRIIPNTAIELGSGVTFISSSNASLQQRKLMSDVFGQMGRVYEVEEERMEAATALSSCGIAFAMQYIQAAAQQGGKMGFSFARACEVVAETVRGAAELVLTGESGVQKEIDKVTTPGGITQRGLEAMREAGFADAVAAGLKACINK